MIEFAKRHSNKCIYIYGVSKRGKRIYNCLKSNGIKVSGYVVSETFKKENEETFYLKDIDSADSAIIIGVQYKTFNTVIPQIIKAGIQNVYFLSGSDIEMLEYYDTHFTDAKNIVEMYPSRWKAYETAKKIFIYLSEAISVKSAIDFGCGSGAWLKAVKTVYPEAKVLGLDSTDIDRSEFLTDAEFVKCDLCNYSVLKKEKYDIAISIEVAEHMEENYGNQFIDNLCKSADIVLFSAAVKYQGGEYHVNEQYPSYWVKKFAERGYAYIDCIRSNFWNDEDMVLHCRQNCILYVKEELKEAIQKKLNDNNEFKDYIHPQQYDNKMSAVYNGYL